MGSERTRVAALAARAVPLLAALAIVWPLAAYRYAASYDLGFHEEIVGAMRYAGDPTHYPPGFLEWNWAMPNQLFYFVAYPLAFVVSAHVACTIVLAASVAAIPLAASRLASHLDKTNWVACAVAPVAIGFPFNVGFATNVLGIAVWLALLPSLDRFAVRPTPARAAEAVGAMLLLELSHESMMVCGAVAIAVLSLGQPLRLRETALRALPPATALAVIAAIHARAFTQKVPLLTGLPMIIDRPRWQKEDDLPEMILGRHAVEQLRPVMWALLAVLVLLAIDAWRTRDRAGARPAGWGARIARWRFAILAGVLVAGYFETPWSIDGATWINQRFISPAVAVLAIVVAPRARKGPSILTRAMSIATVGAMLALELPGFARTSASLTELEALIPLVAPGSAVAHVEIIGGQPRDLVYSIGGAVARVTGARGGRTPSSFLHDSPIPPVVIAARYRWNGVEMLDAKGGLALRPAYDFRLFRYAVVWAMSGDASDAEITAALAPDARFVARSGGWILYESTHDVVSIASPEPVFPAKAETIADRARALARRK